MKLLRLLIYRLESSVLRVLLTMRKTKHFDICVEYYTIGEGKDMANRFTDSRKWDDPWFRKLPCKYKAFFIFLIDKCNHAGIWKVDFESAEFHIGEKLEQKELIEAMNGRIVQLKEKWFIPKFISFQYQVNGPEDLNPENRVHKSVIDLLTKEGACKGLVRGSQGRKDKDKDKDKEGVVKGKSPFLETLKTNIAYKHINLEVELAKMDAWLKLPRNKGRKKTERFVLAWLNRIEATIPAQSKPKPGAAPLQTGVRHDPRVAELIKDTKNKIGL